MRATFAALPAIPTLLIVPPQLSAKGDTIRITIKGGDLAEPIEITDLKVTAGFCVWCGPGTSSNEAHGLIVDWSRGVAKPPNGLPVYEVLLLTTRGDHSTYVVS